MRHALALAVAVALTPVGASAPRAQDVTYGAEVLPGLVDEADLERIAVVLRGATVPIRIEQFLGRHYRPNTLTSEAVAIWYTPEDAEPVLVMPASTLNQATRVEAYNGSEWVEVERHHGSPMFDLVGLTHPTLLPDAPLRQTDGGPSPSLFALAPVTETETGTVLLGVLGPHPSDTYVYYARSLFGVTNGYPLVDVRGGLVAITAFPAPDGEGGVFAIGAAQVEAWYEEWPQIDDSPLGWSPRVVREDLTIQVGDDALR